MIQVKCVNCDKVLQNAKMLVLADNLADDVINKMGLNIFGIVGVGVNDNDELIVSYFCSYPCLQEWLNKCRRHKMGI